jgi:hypothetical protein
MTSTPSPTNLSDVADARNESDCHLSSSDETENHGSGAGATDYHSNAWANINWSTTYSSDEDSQSTVSSHCLFPDHLGEEDEEEVQLARAEGNATADSLGMDTPSSASSSPENDEVAFLIAPPFVDAVAFLPAAPIPFAPSLTPPPVPQRTRRRTQSQSHAIADVSTNVTRDPGGAPALVGISHSRLPTSIRSLHPQGPAARFVMPSSRSLWVTMALMTTVLMFGGVHQNANLPSHAENIPAAHVLPRNADSEGTTVLKTGEILGGAQSIVPPTNPSFLQPANLRGAQRSQFMYAVAARDAPLTFRLKSPGGDGAKAKHTASDSFLLHGLYVSMLAGIVLWSVREFRREVHLRRVGQESVCDLI